MSWTERRRLLLAETSSAVASGPGGRGARFVCALSWVEAGGAALGVVGTLPGRLACEERGVSGFSYDAIFEYEEGRTFAELSEEEKNRVSHRARAVEDLMAGLAGRIRAPGAGTTGATGM